MEPLKVKWQNLTQVNLEKSRLAIYIGVDGGVDLRLVACEYTTYFGQSFCPRSKQLGVDFYTLTPDNIDCVFS